MKAKTINSVICKKFDDWLQSITSDFVRNLVEANSIVTGGCIASMLLKEPVNDFDVYFTNKETVKAVAEYYVKQWNEANGDDGYVLDGANPDNEHNPQFKGGVALNMTPDRIKVVFDSAGVAKEDGALDDAMEVEEFPDGRPQVDEESKPRYRPIYLSCNAITLSQQIQIVIRFYGDPDNIHQHYDYVHCTNYWLSKTRALTLKQPALEALLARELKYIAVLEDQLTGVDVAYFNQLVDALQKHSEKEKEEGREFKLEYSYLATIIDKIF